MKPRNVMVGAIISPDCESVDEAASVLHTAEATQAPHLRTCLKPPTTNHL